MALRYPSLVSRVEPDADPTIQGLEKCASLSLCHGQFPGGVSTNAGCRPGTRREKRAVHPAFPARRRATPKPTRIFRIAALDFHRFTCVEADWIRVLCRVILGNRNEQGVLL